ncbi:uncharacterized protein LY89DRAFT_689855 [Mollisia scopiformis]|uniref:Uncharacterized protein n=1 Tax=Mollisia scopiformis TaxID=149040 RepID=A0A132BC73_MOLSC|nr:uncharacterized protein LY89DRAFT_689855 [Mollisia scopiformis]KUJ09968.1 hypothetical protein LY89DRAFT_689855 [Mollisia scopiformis]
MLGDFPQLFEAVQANSYEHVSEKNESSRCLYMFGDKSKGSDVISGKSLAYVMPDLRW